MMPTRTPCQKQKRMKVKRMLENEVMQEDESWKIENDQQAEWALKKIHDAKAELAYWAEYYKNQLEALTNRTENTVAFMTMKLSEYFRTVPHKETKTKEKYALPSGDLVLVKPKSVWTHDDAALLEWAKKNGREDCVKTTEKISWADLKKSLAESENGTVYDKETGVVCEAVTASKSDPEFTIERMNVE